MSSVKPTQLHFDLPIKIAPKGRPRLGKNGFYTPRKTRLSEYDIKQFIRQKFEHAPITGAVSVSLTFVRAKSKNIKRKYPSTRPDIDNLCKTALDAMNGIVYLDDALIVELHTKKIYGQQDALIIDISVLD